MEKNKKFNWRGWTTFVVTISFIIDTVSGVMLYIAPPGRVANWTNWKIWGLTKAEWSALHIIFSLILMIIIGFHLYYNWKMFINFIWSKIKKALNLKIELATSLLASILIFMMTLWSVPPFSSIIDLGSYFQASWEENKTDAPIPHAELLSLKEFADKTKVPLDKIISAIKAKGYKIKDASQTLGDIAKDNNISPNALYEAVKDQGMKSAAPKTLEGSGIGKKTLEKVCAEQNIPIDKAISRLQNNGINADPKDKMMKIATRANKSPIEIVNILSGQK